MKLRLGQIVITRSAVAYAEEHNVDTFDLLRRHHSCDWSEICTEDQRLNELSLNEGRIVSAYTVDGQKFYVITEYDRSSTCLMLAEDY